MTQQRYIIKRKLNILDFVAQFGNISEACLELGISRRHRIRMYRQNITTHIKFETQRKGRSQLNLPFLISSNSWIVW